MKTHYEIEHLHQPNGWLSPGYLCIDESGLVQDVSGTAPKGSAVFKVRGFGVPGFSNLHSHAFQRALAGRCEFAESKSAEDNLWTWRAQMYDFVSKLTPDDYEAIAAFAYLEMVKFGTTAVGEFHYVHHQPNGARYRTPTEMSLRLIAAAERTGIGITLLPAFYAHSGIGKPPSKQQIRFIHEVEEYLFLLDALRPMAGPLCRIGCAIHSLRAVSQGEIHKIVDAVKTRDPDTRIHIHVSETQAEVEECLAGLGARPVQWLLDNVAVDRRWILVHATHLDDREVAAAAASGAVVAVCPVTEATLGDGLFPLVEYHRNRGAWGIGTDSHYTTSPAEELRILEIMKRLQLGRRNILADSSDRLYSHTGRRLFDLAVAGGNQGLAQNTGSLVPGTRADLVVLDAESPTTIAHGTDTILDAWLLSCTCNPVRDVMIAGRWVVRDGTHVREREILDGYTKSMGRLVSTS